MGVRPTDPPGRSDSIDLVQKDDAGGGLFCLLKDFPNSPLRLPDILGKKLRPLNRDEVNSYLSGKCPRQKRLPGSWWPVQNYPLGGTKLSIGKEGGMLQWPGHRLFKLCFDLLQPSNIFPFHLWDLHENLADGRGLYLLER